LNDFLVAINDGSPVSVNISIENDGLGNEYGIGCRHKTLCIDSEFAEQDLEQAIRDIREADGNVLRFGTLYQRCRGSDSAVVMDD
jgi:hypothetical protein